MLLIMPLHALSQSIPPTPTAAVPDDDIRAVGVIARESSPLEAKAQIAALQKKWRAISSES